MDKLTTEVTFPDGTKHTYTADMEWMFDEDVVRIQLDATYPDGTTHALADIQLDEGTITKDDLCELLLALYDEQSYTNMSISDTIAFLASERLQSDLRAIESISYATGHMLEACNKCKEELVKDAQQALDNAK